MESPSAFLRGVEKIDGLECRLAGLVEGVEQEEGEPCGPALDREHSSNASRPHNCKSGGHPCIVERSLLSGTGCAAGQYLMTGFATQ